MIVFVVLVFVVVFIVVAIASYSILCPSSYSDPFTYSTPLNVRNFMINLFRPVQVSSPDRACLALRMTVALTRVLKLCMRRGEQRLSACWLITKAHASCVKIGVFSQHPF